MAKSVVILGGTGEALDLTNQLAGDLNKAGIKAHIIYCVAGRTSNPRLPAPDMASTVSGGFKQFGGLKKFLRSRDACVLVDALHPFAHSMRLQAAVTAKEIAMPFLRLSQTPWQMELGDRWLVLESLNGIAGVLKRHGLKHPFVALGAAGLNDFIQQIAPDIDGKNKGEKDKFDVLARLVESPDLDTNPPWLEILLSPPPYTFSDDLKLLSSKKRDCVITRNGGQDRARAKCLAARDLQIPVLMIQPPVPEKLRQELRGYPSIARSFLLKEANRVLSKAIKPANMH